MSEPAECQHVFVIDWHNQCERCSKCGREEVEILRDQVINLNAQLAAATVPAPGEAEFEKLLRNEVLAAIHLYLYHIPAGACCDTVIADVMPTYRAVVQPLQGAASHMALARLEADCPDDETLVIHCRELRAKVKALEAGNGERASDDIANICRPKAMTQRRFNTIVSKIQNMGPAQTAQTVQDCVDELWRAIQLRVGMSRAEAVKLVYCADTGSDAHLQRLVDALTQYALSQGERV